MLKYSHKLIGTITFFAILWSSQVYSFDKRPENFTIVPADMWAYWLLLLVPAGLALNPIKFDRDIRNGLWIVVGVLFILLIGLRYNVGGDFDNYLSYYENALAEITIGGFTGETGINFALAYGNAPGYMVLNALIWQLGIWGLHGIYVVNTFCATIFVIGLVKFCRKQPLPWIALAVSVPYMVCGVSMGYTRQAVALGFLMWGLSLLRKGNELKYIALIFAGSLFHLSVIITLPLVLCVRETIPKSLYLMTGLALVYALYMLSTIDIESTEPGSVKNMAIVFQYTATRFSPGGPIRTYMNVLPVLLSLLVWKRIEMISPDYKVIQWMAIATLLSLPALLYSYTMTDRLGIYLMPIQLALWPRFIAVQKTRLLSTLWASGTVGFYGLVLYVFFHYANHSHFWLPYLMYPFTSEPIYPHPFAM